MAKERLSQLQKWILQTAYQKTKEKKLPHDWRHSQSWDGVFTKGDMRVFWQAVYREEILANYFNLAYADKGEKISDKRPWSSFFSCIGDDKKHHNKAMVTMHRSLVNMEQKGLLKKFNEILGLALSDLKTANQILCPRYHRGSSPRKLPKNVRNDQHCHED